MKKNLHIQNIIKNSKKDTEWKKEAEERKAVRQQSKKSGIIATQLAYYMKVYGITQTHLGKMIGVSPQQISKILKGRENLTLGTIEKIEDALQIELISTVNFEKEQIQEASETIIKLDHSHREEHPKGVFEKVEKIDSNEIKFYGGTIEYGYSTVYCSYPMMGINENQDVIENSNRMLRVITNWNNIAKEKRNLFVASIPLNSEEDHGFWFDSKSLLEEDY